MDTLNKLPSWNNTPVKKKILDFVRLVSTPGSGGFVPEDDRVAVIDFDGTLALENRGIAVPGWVEIELFRHLILERFGENPSFEEGKACLDYVHKYYEYTTRYMEEKDFPFDEDLYWEYYFKMISYGIQGLTVRETCDLLSLQMPKTYYGDKTFYQALFKPMVELAKYLMENGFEFFIVSGSNRNAIYTVAKEMLTHNGRDFPYHHCIGADLVIKPRVLEDGTIRMEQTVDYVSINMRFDKCENMARQIGRKPILTIGNGMGDYEMLKWTAQNEKYPTLPIVNIHDDAVREYAYNTEKMLSIAKENGWDTISMKDDLLELYF